MTGTLTYAGIDVAKDRLDVVLRPSGEYVEATKDERGIRSVVRRLRKDDVALAVLACVGPAHETLVWHMPRPRGARSCTGATRPRSQKPLRLVRRALVACTREGDRVFDPFCGSGTTAVASKEMNRSFVGAELEREYAELAARRIGSAGWGGMPEKVYGATGRRG